MNQQESEKFTQVISNGYKELITKRPSKPLEHFIYNILSTLPEEMREKDELLKNFYTQYGETDLKYIKEI